MEPLASIDKISTTVTIIATKQHLIRQTTRKMLCFSFGWNMIMRCSELLLRAHGQRTVYTNGDGAFRKSASLLFQQCLGYLL